MMGIAPSDVPIATANVHQSAFVTTSARKVGGGSPGAIKTNRDNKPA